ncbi:EamA family transporter [Streptomyces capparidis]
MHKSEEAGAAARSTGLTLALISACAFGGSGVAAKPLIEAGLDPLHVVWMRVGGAAIIMLPLVWRHRGLLRRRPALLVGFGLLPVAGVQACYFGAIERVPVSVALLLEYLGPALVLGWVRLVQRKPVSRAAAMGVALAVTGLACVIEAWSGLAFDTVGVLLGLGAACCQASYFILADHGSSSEDPADPLAVSAFGMLIGTGVLTVVARPWNAEWDVLTGRVAMGERDIPGVLLLGWIVLVATVLAYLTGVVSVRRLSPQVAGVVSCLEAVVATVLAWVLLREHLAAPQLAGGLLVLLGAFVAQTSRTARGGGTGPGPGASAAEAGTATGLPGAGQGR